jgi:hypothetical protein
MFGPVAHVGQSVTRITTGVPQSHVVLPDRGVTIFSVESHGPRRRSRYSARANVSAASAAACAEQAIDT